MADSIVAGSKSVAVDLDQCLELSTERDNRNNLSNHVACVRDRARYDAGATYRIVEIGTSAFGVEVCVPGMRPTIVSGMGTHAAAEAWIENHKKQVAAGAIKRQRFRLRSPSTNSQIAAKI